MIVSVNWLKKFTDIDLPIDELVELIGARLVEVEKVTSLGDKYQGVVVARVIECSAIKDSDHLSLTRIDDGGVIKDVERDSKGLVQVVCGASNVRDGLSVAWLPPGAIVPSTFADKEPFKLGTKELKGVNSNGMLASPKELDLYADHSGILEVDKDIKPGTSFSEAYDLDDYLLDIENKSLTHRPDTFGIIGFAREVAAIQGKEFITPQWLAEVDPTLEADTNYDVKLSVKIDGPKICERYQAVVLSNINPNSKTPVEVQTYLARAGVRPISPVVDATNYLMMLTGQPLHAFDYDKLVEVAGGKAEINVRLAAEGEELALLDGRKIKMSRGEIVIAAGDKAVGLAGAMGGANTEIDENTKNVILESATFNLYNLRSTQMRHGIFSEAITRFTKGQPAMLTAPVLAKAVELITEWTDAKQISAVAEDVGEKVDVPTVEVTVSAVNSHLGTALSQGQIKEVLQNIEFAAIESNHSVLVISPPYWRRDIHIKEDIIEEVGRILGFDSINPTLPVRDLTPSDMGDFDKFRTRARKALARLGANEVLTYSFIHGDVIKKANQKLENSYRIVNSISPDLQYYRQSLTPSLLSLVHPNIKQGFDEFAMFEFNKVHPRDAGLDADDVPAEIDSMALIITNKSDKQGAVYYQARAVLDGLTRMLNVELVLKPMSKTDDPAHAIFEPKRSALVYDANNNLVGIIGEYKKSVLREFKLPQRVAGFEMRSRALSEALASTGAKYSKLSRYPGTERDVCFKVKTEVVYSQVIDAAKIALSKSEIESSIVPIDIYQADGADTKNVTIRIKLIAHDHTLTSDEANQIVAAVAGDVVKATGAEVV